MHYPSLTRPGWRQTAICGLAIACITASNPPLPPARLPGQLDGPFALVDVTVITMTPAGTLAHRTVVVDSGRIAAIGPADTLLETVPVLGVPRGTVVLPGLMDLHVHLLDRDEFLLYLANGVTTVRNLHGLGRHLAWRDSLERGQLVGPRLVTSGPILESPPLHRGTNTPVGGPSEAEALVAAQAGAGYDYIKIYDNVPLPVYDALAQAARRHGLPLIGHLPDLVGLDGLFSRGRQAEVEHLEELLPFTADGRDPGLVDSIARGLARGGIAVVPTASVFTSALTQSEALDAHWNRPEMAYVNPATATLWGWRETSASRANNPQAVARYRRTVGFFREVLLPRLHQAGVRIIAGSDAPVAMVVPGFSLLDELEFYRSAGLSPEEVLRTATVDAASALPPHLAATGLGTIRPGAPADLIVLSGDPLQSIGALRDRLGVIARGRWWSADRLQRSLDSLAHAYRAGHRL